MQSYLRVVHNLSLNRVVLNTILIPIHWHVLGVFILVHLRDVLSLVLNGVVVGVLTLVRDLHSLSHLLILHVGALIRNIPKNS